MSMPESPNTTYGAGLSGPTIQGVDLDDVQIWGAAAWDNFKGSGFNIADDFCGDTLDRSIWAAATDVTLSDGAAGGAFGIAEIVPASTGVVRNLLTNAAMPILMGDFFMGARLIINSIGTGTSFVRFGLIGGTNATYFAASLGSANWLVQAPATGAVDTGVAFSAVAYQRIELARRSGVLLAWINGTLINAITATDTDSIQSNFGLTVGRNTGTVSVYVDYAKLWVPR